MMPLNYGVLISEGFVISWIIGKALSEKREKHLIGFIKIPGWLNRMLFIFRKNTPVSFLAVVWQIIYYIIYFPAIFGYLLFDFVISNWISGFLFLVPFIIIPFLSGINESLCNSNIKVVNAMQADLFVSMLKEEKKYIRAPLIELTNIEILVHAQGLDSDVIAALNELVRNFKNVLGVIDKELQEKTRLGCG